MATYAALVSLLNVIDHIQNHPRLSICLDKKQVDSLCEKIEFLLEFIETDSDGVKSGDAEVLEREIACAAYAAEDVIESHVVDQILGKLTTTDHEMSPIKETHSISFSGIKSVIKDIKRKVLTKVKEQMKFQDSIQSHSISLLDLETVIQDIDSVMEKVKEQRRFHEVQPSTYVSSFSTSPTPHHLNTNKMVIGFDDELIRLLDELTGHQSALQIVSIVGMGGIGKTTLARIVYEHPLISHKFDIRSWVTISQQYSVREILSQLLSCKTSDETDEHELGEQLYKSLIGRRYLIVFDDMWSLEAWHNIKQFFPDNKNTSRILVTTRLSDTAAYLGTSLLALKFLDEAKSWELFCEKAFPQVQGCLGELEEIGKKIVKKCEGLPLSITVIGALLSKCPSAEYWENISLKMNSVLDFGDESLDILSLSYSHLPAHLKPCFLYMGVFREDDKIHVSRLIRLWVSEGFIKPNKTQSLEEIAEGYLKDLINRNLILVHNWSRMDGKMETCHMHDLLRDLCLKFAQKEKFLCVMRFDQNVRQGIDNERRFVFHEEIPVSQYAKEKRKEKIPGSKYGLESASLTRSLVSINSLPIRSRLLRVLDIFYDSLPWAEMMMPVNLRYVCIAHSKQAMDSKKFYRILSSMSLLWNLHTLSVYQYWVGRIEAPHAIWQMLQLRHVDINNLHLPDPPTYPPSNQLVLRNLQTLRNVTVSGLNHEVLKRIPNIRELEITYEGVHKHLPEDFGRLHKLESLDLTWLRLSATSILNGDHLLPAEIQFPSSLQKLTLSSCMLRWEQMTLMGALPNLEVLRLQENSVIGSEWSPVEGQFLRLKFLEINGCHIVSWNAESSHFPILEKLVLRYLRYLNEIPSGIGDITTLGLIDVIDSSDSAAFSAMGILAEQESLGYEDLQLRIMFWNEDEVRKFKENAEQVEGFTSTRLQICLRVGIWELEES